MPYVTADDGAQIYYQDHGTEGPPVILSHGWPLSSDAWSAAAVFLAEHGFRVIAHDRRGHGRSSQTWYGNDMDSWADDLACLVRRLDLHDLTLVGHGAGGGEVVRYVGRHGTGRVDQVVLVSAVPPLLAQSEEDPEGLPLTVFDSLRGRLRRSRSQLYRELADGPVFGHDRRGDVPQGVRDAFWLQAMACGHRAAHEGIAAFSATDFRRDLAVIDVPTLVIHGDDDQVVPFDRAGRRTADLVAGAELRVYEGSPHALPDTDRERLHGDLLAFIAG